jgi:hypothetical protein
VRCQFLGWAHQRIGSGMLFHKPAGEFLAKGTGFLFAFRKRNQLICL